ncbi:HU family DNA-binding protein [Candidatus Trichorickettsia mobilis]|uniref:HU family DNA-binding protein n=1 Tax=Candidatus Trichorickettsia mobilis TaxID=1346319 RepID=A0ABZ0UVQ3_9RICK|nr:HU family DNA-binding protein [Candidatus Trichorickettsia mobilis]WPY01058.1 HU family DNA-binding protein [Candidatus Trichorickettsia mobilis]
MNKGELISLMAELSGNSKADAERALNNVTDSVIMALSKGHDINLVGFGSFQVQNRQAREGRNPKTGEKMHIAAYKQPVFKAGKKMKDACN